MVISECVVITIHVVTTRNVVAISIAYIKVTTFPALFPPFLHAQSSCTLHQCSAVQGSAVQCRAGQGRAGQCWAAEAVQGSVWERECFHEYTLRARLCIHIYMHCLCHENVHGSPEISGESKLVSN